VGPPNSAGVVIDAVRGKLALDRGIGWTINRSSSYFMKTPPKQFKDEIAHEMTEAISVAKDNLRVKTVYMGIQAGMV
jgi:myo-inositol-1-phosphate synthase